MLIGLGEKHGGGDGDVIDLFLSCHARIRRFTALALRLAEERPFKAEEVREAAGAVHRYFTVALPLHARDEEESVLPRLRGLDPALDAALTAMHAEHGEHGPDLQRLTDLCARIAADPTRLDALRADLAEAAEDVSRHFEAHLPPEEAIIFPALRRLLPAAELQAIGRELHGRRAVGASDDAAK